MRIYLKEENVMAQARASVEAMDRMIRNVTKFMTNQQALMSALRNDYATVGEEWNDPKYQQLGETLNQAITAISGSSASLSECVTKLQLLKGKLEEYLSQQV